MNFNLKTEMRNILTLLSARKDYVLLIMAIIVLAAGLIGAALRQPAKNKDVPVLVFTHWWDKELENGIPESLIAEFEETNGNVKIVLKSLSYSEIKKLLLDSDYGTYEAGTDELPGDILTIDRIWIQELYNNGVLEPSYPPSEPLASFFYPLFYNIEILKNAGFNRPPKTRSEFLSMAEAVTNPGSGIYGVAFALGNENPFGVYRDIYPWFWASGISMLDSGRSFQETLDFFSRLNSGNMIHPGIHSMTEAEKVEAFIKNKIAFMTGSIKNIENFRKKMGEEAFGIGIVPGADSYSGKPVFGVSDWNLGIFSHSKHKEKAEAFIRFLTEKSAFLAEKNNVIPGSGGSLSPEMMRDPFYSKAWELYIGSNLKREFSEPHANNKILNSTQRDTIFREVFLAIFEEKHDPSSAAAAIRAGWEQ